MCKFFKKIIFIKKNNIQTVKKQANAFFSRLHVVDWGLFRELITNHNLKFFNKFWTILFNKLKIKLYYNMAYHPQINGSNIRINQMIKMAFRFFVYMLNDLTQQSHILLHIKAIINNIFFLITKKTSNKIAYNFIPRWFLNLFLALSTHNTLIVQIDAFKTILFALFNQKLAYNYKQQLLFIKVVEQTMLYLYKSYFIPSIAGVIKKLIQ